jgi:hypothetical protein
VAEAIKAQKPETTVGFVGAHAAVLPAETLKASPAIDWVGARSSTSPARKSPRGAPLAIAGLSYRDKPTAGSGTIPSAS